MSDQFIQTLLAALLSPVVVVAGLTAIQNLRKRKAEQPKVNAQTESIGRQADNVTIARLVSEVQRLSDDRDDLRAEQKTNEDRIDVLETKVRENEIEKQEWMRVLQLHSAWDMIAVAEVRTVRPDSPLTDPPPLTPPTLKRPNRPTQEKNP